MRTALCRSGPAIHAPAGTIAVGLACLAFAGINVSRSLGLVGAVGVVCGFLAMVTVLPALLVIAGRRVFWPFVPRFGTPARKTKTIWSRIGAAVAKRPRWAWMMSVAVTGVLALSAPGIHIGLTQSEMFQDKPESVGAQEQVPRPLLARRPAQPPDRRPWPLGAAVLSRTTKVVASSTWYGWTALPAAASRSMRKAVAAMASSG